LYWPHVSSDSLSPLSWLARFLGAWSLLQQFTTIHYNEISGFFRNADSLTRGYFLVYIRFGGF